MLIVKEAMKLWRLRVYGDSVFPAKFSYEPETALKNKAYLNKSRIFKVTLKAFVVSIFPNTVVTPCSRKVKNSLRPRLGALQRPKFPYRYSSWS